MQSVVRIVACAGMWAALGIGMACATEPASPDATAAVAAARIAVAGGDLVRAVRDLQSFVTAHPADRDAARYLGDLYYRQSDLASAERVYLALLKLAPNDRETHNRLGGIYAAEDRRGDAIAQFTLSLPSVSAYGHLVDLHRRIGDVASFVENFRRDANFQRQDAGAQYAAGAVLRASGHAADAAIYLERALAILPHSCPTLAELGSAYLDLDRTDAAVDVLGRCLQLEPENYAALVNLGDAEIARGKTERARDVLERANRVRPEAPEALIDIGYLEDVAGRWQSAVAYYLRAIAFDPLARDAYVDLGYDYDEHRLFALAEAAFLKGLSVSPGDGRLHYLLGVTYAGQGKRELARAEYAKAIAGDEPAVARAATRDLASLH